VISILAKILEKFTKWFWSSKRKGTKLQRIHWKRTNKGFRSNFLVKTTNNRSTMASSKYSWDAKIRR